MYSACGEAVFYYLHWQLLAHKSQTHMSWDRELGGFSTPQGAHAKVMCGL
jgi:hypothetical protein